MPVTIHILFGGHSRCDRVTGTPNLWPLGHIWIRDEELKATQDAIAAPENPIHSPMRMQLCEACVEIAKLHPERGR